MDFHVTAVERHLTGRIGCSGDRREYRLPNASLAPARKPIVDRLVRSVLARTVLPTTPNALHMHDTAQNPSIILALWATLIGRQMRLNFRPLFVVKPKQAGIHRLVSNRITNPLNQHMVN
jgi:hypothetical protein